MAKRVKFEEDFNCVNEIANIQRLKKYKNNELNDDIEEASDYKKKHTLDSDEEDEIEKYQQYDIEKVFFNVICF